MNKLIAEFLGSLVVCATALVSRDGLATACALAAVTYAFGYVSGGHFNPAVSVAVWLRGRMSQTEMVRYFAAQFTGGLAAFVVFKLLGGGSGAVAKIAALAALNAAAGNAEASGGGMGALIASEFLFTALLATVILHTTTSKQLAGNQFYGLATGMCLLAGASCAGAASAWAFNPALGLGLVLTGAAPPSWLLIHLLAGAAAGAAATTGYRLLNPND